MLVCFGVTFLRVVASDMTIHRVAAAVDFPAVLARDFCVAQVRARDVFAEARVEEGLLVRAPVPQTDVTRVLLPRAGEVDLAQVLRDLRGLAALDRPHAHVPQARRRPRLLADA